MVFILNSNTMKSELKNDVLKNVSEKVILKRRELDMKQNDLAEKANVSQVLISMLERGTDSMSINKLQSITNALGLRLVIDVQDVQEEEPAVN